jgi:hypothetical protein
MFTGLLFSNSGDSTQDAAAIAAAESLGLYLVTQGYTQPLILTDYPLVTEVGGVPMQTKDAYGASVANLTDTEPSPPAPADTMIQRGYLMLCPTAAVSVAVSYLSDNSLPAATNVGAYPGCMPGLVDPYTDRQWSKTQPPG